MSGGALSHRRAASVAAGFLAALALAGCGPQQLRGDSAPDAESAAVAAMQLEPGAAPRPALLNPSVARRGRLRTGDQSVPLRLDAAAGRHDDTWARIRDQLSLPVEDRPRTRREIDWFQRNQDYLDRVADRARYYLPHIVREVERRDLPIELALLPIVESAFQPFAHSHAGASGIWQFIPSTGRVFGLRQSWWYDGRRDILDSTRAALDYLSKLERDFPGEWELALAAYNWGEGNVERALQRNRRQNKGTDFWSLRLPAETRAYVPKLLALAAIVADPDRYGLTLRPVPDDVYFARVELDGQIDLGLAAELAEMSLDEMYLLNPGFHRWATDPEGPHQLLVPRDRAAAFTSRLAALAPEERVRFTRHSVRAGETLGQIANRYGTSVDALRSTNELKGTIIRSGQDLVVPVAARRDDGPSLSADMRRVLQRIGPPVRGRSLVYRIRPGDSLWSIARRHGVSIKRLASWNGISERGVLRPGQRLKIWRGGREPAPVRPQVAARAAGDNTATYTILPGDSLSVIALRHRVSVRELAAWNSMSVDDVLRPGQTLSLRQQDGATEAREPAEPAPPRAVSYTVRPGDSLWKISQRFGVSVGALQQWNGLTTSSTLLPGQTLELFPGGAAGRLDRI